MAPQGNLIHTESVNVTTSIEEGTGATKYVAGVAVVTILDNNNNPIKDAKVSGYWSGSTTGTKSSVTNETGAVKVCSDKVFHNGGSGTLTFTFNVNNVTHSSYTWDNITKAGTKIYS